MTGNVLKMRRGERRYRQGFWRGVSFALFVMAAAAGIAMLIIK